MCPSARDSAQVIKYTMRTRTWGASRQQHIAHVARACRLRACGDKVGRRMYRLCSLCLYARHLRMLFREALQSVSPPDARPSVLAGRLSRVLSDKEGR